MRTLLLAFSLAMSLPLPAQTPPPGESFDLAALTARLTDSGGTWLPFLDRRSLSCGIYKLAKGAKDAQSPHALDEVYFVIEGRAKLDIAGTRHAADRGAVLFVAAGVPHHFVDIEADLTTLVFFSNARPTRGGMAAGPKPTEPTPYDEGSERGSARVFYWFAGSSAGQVEITYGRPDWKPEYDAFLSRPGGQRWRFGENFWTTLDTNLPLTIAGVDLAIGQYYLVLHNDAEHGVHLLALDPQTVRQRRLDAYEAGKTAGGIAIPLQHQEGGPVSQRLTIDLRVDRAEKHRAELIVRFGRHTLSAPVGMKP